MLRPHRGPLRPLTSQPCRLLPRRVLLRHRARRSLPKYLCFSNRLQLQAMMRKKHISDFAFLSRSASAVLLLCAVTCFVVTRTLPAFFHSDAPASRTLSFAERVAYQRAIEDVYWRHRIWPKDRPD